MSAEVEDRPGPLGWGVIAVGWVVIAVALVAGFTDDRLGGPGSWVVWLLGAAVVHDAILLPAVVLVGVVLARVVPPTWRPAVRAALVVGGIVALTVWPIARRWGARADNPSILPVPVARNLAILLGALAITALVAGLLSARRSRTGADGIEPETA